MEKIDISQSVKTLEFGSKYEARIQRIFREFDIKTIRDLCQWPGKDLVRGVWLYPYSARCCAARQSLSPVGNAR